MLEPGFLGPLVFSITWEGGAPLLPCGIMWLSDLLVLRHGHDKEPRCVIKAVIWTIAYRKEFITFEYG